VVKNGFTRLVKNPDIHGPGVKIDSAVLHVLPVIESHWVSSFCFSTRQDTMSSPYLGGGLI